MVASMQMLQSTFIFHLILHAQSLYRSSSAAMMFRLPSTATTSLS